MYDQYIIGVYYNQGQIFLIVAIVLFASAVLLHYCNYAVLRYCLIALLLNFIKTLLQSCNISMILCIFAIATTNIIY